METSFWKKKWEDNQIGFHQQKYNPYLVRNWKVIATEMGSRVFVPLCGKTKDMLFLVESGFKVLGVELVESAVREFFQESSIDYTIDEKSNYKIYKSENINIIVGDIFILPESEFSECKYLYDRASIVALPLVMRQNLVKVITEKMSLKSGLMITMSFDDPELGPPFSVPPVDVKDLFSGSVSVEELEILQEDGDDISVHVGKIEHRFEYAMKLLF